ncbi:hypothetical protein TGP89_275390, partial [Toxoplasma gondii p89]
RRRRRRRRSQGTGLCVPKTYRHSSPEDSVCVQARQNENERMQSAKASFG